MNPWLIVSIVLLLVCIYLSMRVYNLRKGLNQVLVRLAEIERKVPVLKP